MGHFSGFRQQILPLGDLFGDLPAPSDGDLVESRQGHCQCWWRRHSVNVSGFEPSLPGGTQGTFSQVSHLLSSETCPVASLCPPSAKWGNGVRLSHSLLAGSGGRSSGVLLPEAFWVLLMGQGWGGAHRKSPPSTDHRRATETREGPGAQDQSKCPFPKELEGRQSVLGGKMGHSPCPSWTP